VSAHPTGGGAALAVPDLVARAVEAHVRTCLPEEACGLLAFDAGGRMRFAYPLTNADRSPVSFTVAPDEHFGAVRHAERNGWEVMGAFHSHPATEPVPSETDVARAPDTDWVHLLAGMDGDAVVIRAFRSVDGRVSEIPVHPGG
jgi:[CysO sulfur-carrier protein]-S-L-cysteine hydrolase